MSFSEPSCETWAAGCTVSASRLSLTHSLTHSFSLFLSLSLFFFSLALSLSLSLYLSGSLAFSLCVCAFLSLFLFVSFSLFLAFSLCLFLSLSLSLSPSPKSTIFSLQRLLGLAAEFGSQQGSSVASRLSSNLVFSFALAVLMVLILRYAAKG